MDLQSTRDIPEEPVTAYSSVGTTIQWLRRKESGSPFMLRIFAVAPGGVIGVHSHPEEHQIVMLEGDLDLLDAAGEVVARAAAGDFLYVPPDEPHGYYNASAAPARFVCGINRV